MDKQEFLDRLYVEMLHCLIKESEFEEEPAIDLFNSKSDKDKIINYIRYKFNYAFNRLINENPSVRKFVTLNNRSIPNMYLNVNHVLSDEEIQDFAEDLFLYSFIGEDGAYLNYVTNYLDDKAETLTEQDAYKYLLYLNLKSADDYMDWYLINKPKFLNVIQVFFFLYDELIDRRIKSSLSRGDAKVNTNVKNYYETFNL